MTARIKTGAGLLPDAMKAILALNTAVQNGSVPAATLSLSHLRASQINGCSACVESGTQHALKAGETAERLFAVAAWHESPYFNDAERAALALTESVTRIADASDPVPDAIWDEAAKHYDDKALMTLLLSIATTNVFNRLNVSTRQPPQNW